MDPMTLFTTLVAKNPIAAAGLPLMVFGAVLTKLKMLPDRAIDLFSSFFHFSISVDNTTPVHGYVKQWLTEQPFTDRAKHVTMSTVYTTDGKRNYEHSDTSISVVITPAPGWNFAWIEGHPIIFRFNREKSGDSNGGSPRLAAKPIETVIARAFTRKGLNAVKAKFIEIGKNIEGNFENKVKIFGSRGSYSSSWELTGAVEKRPANTVVSDKDLLTNIIDDIKKFKSSREWYREKGIPWRRGYLLYGPVGTGKSSSLLAIASELNMDVYYLDPKNAGDGHILAEVPENGMIVVEEVDTLFDKRGVKPARRRGGNIAARVFEDLQETISEESENTLDDINKQNQKELNAFINALDGIIAGEGRVLFMTTNHLDLLDPALIRPGRADRQFYIGNATSYQLKHMFLKFFPGEEGLANAFTEAVPEHLVSMALLQEHLMSYRESAMLAYEKHPEMVKTTQKKADNLGPTDGTTRAATA